MHFNSIALKIAHLSHAKIFIWAMVNPWNDLVLRFHNLVNKIHTQTSSCLLIGKCILFLFFCQFQRYELRFVSCIRIMIVATKDQFFENVIYRNILNEVLILKHRKNHFGKENISLTKIIISLKFQLIMLLLIL